MSDNDGCLAFICGAAAVLIVVFAFTLSSNEKRLCRIAGAPYDAKVVRVDERLAAVFVRDGALTAVWLEPATEADHE